MAPPPSPQPDTPTTPPHSFFADQIAQDAFDANLNKTVFLIALAFAVLIQICVLVYLGWLVVRRCCSGRSRGDDVPEECEGEEAYGVKAGGEGERKCAKGELEVPSLPRELVLPGLLTEDTPPPPATLPSRHHRSPSLRESIFGSSDSQHNDNQKRATSSSWFNLCWSWEVPVVQIDLERAAAPASLTQSSASTAASVATTTTDSTTPTASPASIAGPDSAAGSASPTTTPTSASSSHFQPRSPSAILTLEQQLPSTSAATPTQTLVPRIVIEDVDCPSPSAITDVDSALDSPTIHQEEGEEIQTRIDPSYLYVPPTSCYPPRELVESPSGRGFDVSFFSSPGSSLDGSASNSYLYSSCSAVDRTSEDESTKTKTKTKSKSKTAKRKSPGAYENTNTFSTDENTTQPSRTKDKTLSSRLFGALADLSNLHFTGLTLPTGSTGSASPASPNSSASSSLKLPTTPKLAVASNSESFFSRCEEALSTAPGTFADGEAMYDGIMW